MDREAAMMDNQGRFIIVEGIDGSGKDTQAELLAESMEQHGHKVLLTGSPTKWYREQPAVASFIKNGKTRLGQNTLAALGAADRMMQIDQEILPAIRRGVDVICVRYVYSAYGYFQKRGADIRYVEALNSLTLVPTHGLLLTLNPQDAVGRVKGRDGNVSFEERADYLADVQAEMVRRWPSNYLSINASLPREEIAKVMLNYVLA
jgi:dTMP kinase